MCMPCTSFVDALRKECAELHLFFGIMSCMKATLMLILGQLLKKNVILLEFYKQEFKQGWFMLLLLTFYNEEANILIARSQTCLLLPNKCISYRYDENFSYGCAQFLLTENTQTANISTLI